MSGRISQITKITTREVPIPDGIFRPGPAPESLPQNRPGLLHCTSSNGIHNEHHRLRFHQKTTLSWLLAPRNGIWTLASAGIVPCDPAAALPRFRDVTALHRLSPCFPPPPSAPFDPARSLKAVSSAFCISNHIPRNLPPIDGCRFHFASRYRYLIY